MAYYTKFEPSLLVCDQTDGMDDICRLKEETRVAGWEEVCKKMDAMEERLASILSLTLAIRWTHKSQA